MFLFFYFVYFLVFLLFLFLFYFLLFSFNLFLILILILILLLHFWLLQLILHFAIKLVPLRYKLIIRINLNIILLSKITLLNLLRWFLLHPLIFIILPCLINFLNPLSLILRLTLFYIFLYQIHEWWIRYIVGYVFYRQIFDTWSAYGIESVIVVLLDVTVGVGEFVDLYENLDIFLVEQIAIVLD